MNAQTFVERYRAFLLGLAGFLSAGTIIELWLAKHREQPMQFVPFVLCSIALVAILTVLFKPEATTIRALRVVMGLLALGSLVGVYEHLQGNWEILFETRPNLGMTEMF